MNRKGTIREVAQKEAGSERGFIRCHPTKTSGGPPDHEWTGVEFPKTKASRSPPVGRLSAEEDGQIDPRAEKWDGKDDEVPDERPA